MASRDQSQGFAFVYTDISKLLKGEWSEVGPLPTFDAKTVNFNKDAQFSRATESNSEAPTAAPAVEEQAPRTPVQQIRENLDRLQTLHHRIHVMLEELNQLNGRKKDPKDEN